jgi:hypothetical protein
MRQINSFRQIIDWWPTQSALAVELDVSRHVVQQWKRMGIPAGYWQALLETKIARRNRLTAAVLVRLADHRHRQS